MPYFSALPFLGHTSLCLTLTLSILADSSQSHAVSFGVYDARTMGLAGTSVALGTPAEGHFYNPALTALHEGDEDETKDGRYILPLLATVSDAAKTSYDAINDGLEDDLRNAVEAFNVDPSVATALEGIDSARELQDLLEHLQGDEIFLDSYAGFSVSEPGDREGGAVFFGARFVGSGIANISDTDIELLDDYLEALEFISSGGAEGEQNPQLFDPDNGALLNPNDAFTSTGRAQGLLVAELAVSFAKQFYISGHSVAFGLAPKVMALTILEGDWEVSDGNFTSADEDDATLLFNSDIGVATTFKDVWRVGLSVKDVIPKTVNTELGNTFKLKPRSRFGLAYLGSRFQIGLDADLTANPIASSGLERRDVSIGTEVSVAKGWSLRAGYRQDLEDIVGSATSFGVSLRLTRLMLDAAYVTGDDQVGASLQVSFIQ